MWFDLLAIVILISVWSSVYEEQGHAQPVS